VTDHSARAAILTANASRYLQQLCKHWSHNLAVEFTAEQGTVVFPKDIRGQSFPAQGTVTLRATESELAVLIDASSPEQLEGLKGAIAKHLDRFAFREAPLSFDWR